MSGERALLDRGVAAGVITAAQRDALLALPALPALPVTPPKAGASDERHDVARAKAGVDGVLIAYTVGAALVVFALGWFLVDRWHTLGPLGVLGVALVYAALFAL